MNVAGRLALWLATLLAVWSTAAALTALRTSRADIARQAVRGLVGAAAAASAALCVMVAALVTHDFRVRFVAARASVLMPDRYLPNAVLGAPSGALLAFATVAGLLSLVVVRRAAGPRERSWAVASGAGLLSIALLIATTGSPFARTFGYRADGSVLSPDLQRGSAVLHGLSLLAGSACATAAFAATIAALAAGRLADRWSTDVRRWNAVAWCLFFAAAVAGARWHAVNPLRGPWLAARSTEIWLLPCAMGAWLVHLDAGHSTPARVVTRMLLVATTFVAACGAVSLEGGTFIHGLADATGTGGRWFGAAAVAALVLTVAIVRSARGAVRTGAVAAPSSPPRARVPGIVAHVGFALVVAAAAGGHYTRSHPVRLADTEIFRAKDPFGRQWSFTSEGTSTLQHEDYSAVTYALRPDREGVRGDVVLADARSYGLADQDSAGLAAFTSGIIRGPLVETRVSVEDPSQTPAMLRITFVPLASWAVPGAGLVVLGTLLPLLGVHSRHDPAGPVDA